MEALSKTFRFYNILPTYKIKSQIMIRYWTKHLSSAQILMRKNTASYSLKCHPNIGVEPFQKYKSGPTCLSGSRWKYQASAQVKSTRLYSQNSMSGTNKPKQENMPPPHPSVIRRLASIEDSLRFHGYSTIRWGFVLLGTVGLTVYIFREYIRSTVVEEVSNVASRSLEDEMVKNKAHQLSVALLHAILSDAETHTNAVIFLQDVLSKKETQSAASHLVSNVLNDPQTQTVLSTSLKKVLNNAFKDDLFRKQFLNQLMALLQEPAMQEALIKLVLKVLNNSYVKQGAQDLAIDVVRSKQVIETASQVGKTLVEEVVQDSLVQKKTGDGLYKAFVHSVTPRVFSRGSKTQREDQVDQDSIETTNKTVPVKSSNINDTVKSSNINDNP